MRRTEPQFVVCIRNKDYPASLESRKLYYVIADAEAAGHQQFRVVDESGEDYLYPGYPTRTGVMVSESVQHKRIPIS